MKYIKLLLVVMAAALITLGLSGNVLAFHEGGVAHCDGCHTMHNSEDGEAVIEGTTPGTGSNSNLTIGTDSSSTCLSCHEGSGSYHMATPDGDLTPNRTAGGDFAWLKYDYEVDFGWRKATLDGELFGHNIIAADFGYVQSTVLPSAPTSEGLAGSFLASDLACSSCHDPHGKVARDSNIYDPIAGSGSYGGTDSGGEAIDTTDGVLGNYRLLGSTGYEPDGAAGGFAAPAPIARASIGGFGTFYSEKVDYGSGMSEWCANCHKGLDAVSKGSHRHPANNAAVMNGQAGNYNRYVATGDYSGAIADAYLGLVPFERGETDPTMLDPESTMGADADSNVMCLTCHRAHAGGYRDAGRWDFQTELLTHSNPSPGDPGYPWALEEGYYYAGVVIDIATDFNASQRSLCNKCHMQD